MTEETGSSMAVDWTVAGRIFTKDSITTTDCIFRPTFYTEQRIPIFSQQRLVQYYLDTEIKYTNPFPATPSPTVAAVLPHRTAPHYTTPHHTIPRPDRAEQSRTKYTTHQHNHPISPNHQYPHPPLTLPTQTYRQRVTSPEQLLNNLLATSIRSVI